MKLDKKNNSISHEPKRRKLREFSNSFVTKYRKMRYFSSKYFLKNDLFSRTC